MRSVRIISNGHGEDAIAAQIISALGIQSFHYTPIPLVGSGVSYHQLGIPPKLVQDQLPSGGFLLRFKDFLSDIRSGLLPQFNKQRQTLRSFGADYQLVVGDVYALFMATYHSNIPTVFFPTAKSERSIPHYSVEFYYIRTHAQLVFPRDIETHQVFYKKRIPTRFFGNPMFDGMTSSVKKPTKLTLLLLPGSRKEAIYNMKTMLSILDQMNLKKQLDFIVCLSSHFKYSDLKQVISNLPWIIKKHQDKWVFQHTRKPLQLVVLHDFHDALQQSSLVLGLAGTANEQSMHANRQLISFIGSGPQSTKKRFMQQHRLIEGAQPVLIPSNDPTVISEKLSLLINSTEFQWTPLSDYHQNVSKDISQCLLNEFFSS